MHRCGLKKEFMFLNLLLAACMVDLRADRAERETKNLLHVNFMQFAGVWDRAHISGNTYKYVDCCRDSVMYNPSRGLCF